MPAEKIEPKPFMRKLLIANFVVLLVDVFVVIFVPVPLLLSQAPALLFTLMVATWWLAQRQLGVRGNGRELTLILVVGLITFGVVLPFRIFLNNFMADDFVSPEIYKIAGTCQVYADAHGGHYPASLLDIIHEPELSSPSGPISISPVDLVLRGSRDSNEYFATVASLRTAHERDINLWSDFIYLGVGLTSEDIQKHPEIVLLYTKPLYSWGRSRMAFINGGQIRVSDAELSQMLKVSDGIRAKLGRHQPDTAPTTAPIAHPAVSGGDGTHLRANNPPR